MMYPDTRNFLRVMLGESKAGVPVNEALEILEWFRPQILVSDLAMPNEDGYSLIARLRELESSGNGIPALALTSYVCGGIARAPSPQALICLCPSRFNRTN